MTTHDGERLPADLVFEVDGHVGEVVLACIADGEIGLVPEDALTHVDACDTCTGRLGAAALRSIGARDAMLALAARDAEVSTAIVAAPAPHAGAMTIAAPPRAAPSSRRRRPVPFAAIAAALLIAAAAAVPGLLDTVEGAPDTIRGVIGLAPVVTRAALALLRAAPALGPAMTIAMWASAVGFVAVGLGVARARSRGLAGTR